MSINVNNSSDLSFLFSSLNNKSGLSNTIFGMSDLLGDYASIRNGSMAKLAKSYYSNDKKNDVTGKLGKVNEFDSDDKTIKKDKALISDAASLRSSISSLVNDDKIFNEKVTKTDENGVETTDYDRSAISKKINSFVKNYNSMVDSGADAEDSTILRNVLNMTEATERQKGSLSSVGITVNSNNTLSVDEEKLKSADVSTLKSLFGKTGSYAATVDGLATNVASKAAQDVYSLGGYNSTGAYKQALESIYNTQV